MFWSTVPSAAHKDSHLDLVSPPEASVRRTNESKKWSSSLFSSPEISDKSYEKDHFNRGVLTAHRHTHTHTHTHTLSRTGRFMAEDFVVVNESTKVGSNGAYVTAVGEPAVKGT